MTVESQRFKVSVQNDNINGLLSVLEFGDSSHFCSQKIKLQKICQILDKLILDNKF